MGTKTQTGHLIIFSKAPIAGQVKTRLQADIGPEACAELQRRMILKTVATAIASSAEKVSLYASPDAHHPLFQALGKQHRISLVEQSGQSLGERMSRALRDTLKDDQAVILIGTDCPALSPETLDRCLDMLNNSDGCVLVPATDGGYVLIGLNSYHPELFADIDWGSNRVLQQTEMKLRQLGLVYHCLTALPDIDTIDDLRDCKELEISDLLP